MVCFRTLYKSGIVDNKTKLEFIGFGTMNGKDGKPFKTRDGGVMKLETLLDEIKKESNEYLKKENDNHFLYFLELFSFSFAFPASLLSL